MMETNEHQIVMDNSFLKGGGVMNNKASYNQPLSALQSN